MKTYAFLPTTILLGGLLLASCGTDSGDATQETTEQLQENKQEMAEAKADDREAWRAERDEAVRELRDLRNTFENERAREQTRLADGIKDAKKKAECEANISELNKNIARIDASLLKLEASTGADWADNRPFTVRYSALGGNELRIHHR